MTRIGLEAMEFYAFHGYYEAERKMGNSYLLDVHVTLKDNLSNSEDIGDTVNYEHIYAVCKSEMAKPQKLLETVVFNIAEKLNALEKNIDKVEIKLRKTSVQLGGKLGASVVEYHS